MSGEEFALKLSSYLQSIGEKTSSVGVIKVNPDQSKHLATATMKILDVSIDINNFREEVYRPDSRIPDITLATAEEDARRRDFTVRRTHADHRIAVTWMAHIDSFRCAWSLRSLTSAARLPSPPPLPVSDQQPVLQHPHSSGGGQCRRHFGSSVRSDPHSA